MRPLTRNPQITVFASVPTTVRYRPNDRIPVVVLPNSSKAVIAPEKLRDYLLSPIHPIGRYKALFFRTLGYDQTSWQQLATDLQSLASLPAEPLESTEYGTKYAIIGPLMGLNGRVAEIVTVWIILAGTDVPRFVTAYPKD
jgi:hypothetical protein